MSAGWKITDSSGEVHKSMASAARAYIEDNSLTFTESTVSMAGTNSSDATEKVIKFAKTLRMYL